MVSTHDLSLASQRFDLVLLINRQLIAYGPPEQVFTSQAISRAFGSKVLRLNDMIVVDDCCPPDDETGEGHRSSNGLLTRWPTPLCSDRGLLAAIMVGVLSAVIGCYVVLRSMAFLGDTLAHSVLPGVAVAYLSRRT